MTEQVSHCNPSLSDANFALSCEKVLSELTRPDQSTIDEILKHDTHDKPEIILPDGRKFVWYFAIGSMINPISLYLRNIIPLISYPAKCRNHKIVFREQNGRADIEGYPEDLNVVPLSHNGTCYEHSIEFDETMSVSNDHPFGVCGSI
ncbi:unnamed protein product [Rotaria sordida]|uniref:Uncharacterized protein n=1 Tax=Rotaria sordida TaxID=392033 RepID=A0A815B978_9BILA|nr:unnamed protein product [Rotaria sordida]